MTGRVGCGGTTGNAARFHRVPENVHSRLLREYRARYLDMPICSNAPPIVNFTTIRSARTVKRSRLTTERRRLEAKTLSSNGFTATPPPRAADLLANPGAVA
jgi:hypothetical protein